MKKQKSVKSKKENNPQIFSKKLFKGACVKIKNSEKTFQVIGLNPANKVCWLREWPVASSAKKSFAIQMSQITLKIFCSNQFAE